MRYHRRRNGDIYHQLRILRICVLEELKRRRLKNGIGFMEVLSFYGGQNQNGQKSNYFEPKPFPTAAVAAIGIQPKVASQDPFYEALLRKEGWLLKLRHIALVRKIALSWRQKASVAGPRTRA